MITVAFTKPMIHTTSNAPVFKTQQRCGGRALAADAFVRPMNTTGQHTVPGFGSIAHREGYNVLYGDYHSAWYAGIEQRVMYQPAFGESNGYGYYGNCAMNSNQQYFGSMFHPGLLSKYARQMGIPYIWHGFDDAGGMDVGVTDSYDP